MSPTRQTAWRRMRCLVAALALLLTVPTIAGAQSLPELRAQGIVGERYDGYAVARSPNPSPEIQRFLADVNARRREVYAARAAEQKVPIDQVGRVYALEVLRGAPAGTWALDEAGRWVQK